MKRSSIQTPMPVSLSGVMLVVLTRGGEPAMANKLDGDRADREEVDVRCRYGKTGWRYGWRRGKKKIVREAG